MSTFRLRHFSKPAVLRHVQPDALLMLLTRAGGTYVDSRMPRLVADGHLLVDEVAAMLASPQEGFPAALVNALHQVDEVSHDEGLDAMLTLAEERGVALPDLPADATPADVAVRLWLRDPDCVDRVHAEQSIERRRTFESYMGLGRRLSLEVPRPDAATLAALTDDLDTFFERRKRGRLGGRARPAEHGGRALAALPREGLGAEGAAAGRQRAVRVSEPWGGA